MERAGGGGANTWTSLLKKLSFLGLKREFEKLLNFSKEYI